MAGMLSGQQQRMAGLGFDYREKFTPNEIERYKECFTFFDREGDSCMIKGDVALALRAMGALVTGSEIESLMRKYDPDRTEKISQEDYLNMLAEITLDSNQNGNEEAATIQAAFSPFDKAEGGMLDLEEMRHVLTRIGDALGPDEAANFLGIIDKYGDGFGRLGDLTEMMLP